MAGVTGLEPATSGVTGRAKSERPQCPLQLHGSRAAALSAGELERRPAPRTAFAVAADLRDVARAVRCIGDGYRSNPETIALAKDNLARRLHLLAREVEAAV
jgi:hypothetical protein